MCFFLFLPPPLLDDSIWQELSIKKKIQTAFVLPQQTSLGKWCSLLSNSCSAQSANTRKTAGVTSYSPLRPRNSSSQKQTEAETNEELLMKKCVMISVQCYFQLVFFKEMHPVSHDNTELVNNPSQQSPNCGKSFLSSGNWNNGFNEKSRPVVKIVQRWSGQWAWAAATTMSEPEPSLQH